MNATLYSTDPASYLRFRLHTLVLAHNERPDVSQTETTYGSLRLPPLDLTPEERSRALAMESATLVQHAGESFMRLYFAHHRMGHPCPWLDITKLDFRTVNSNLAEMTRLNHVWTAGQVESVFLGGADLAESGLDVTAEHWEAAVDAHTELLRRVAERVLARAPMYNAVRHGLVGAPSERLGLSIDTGDQKIRMADGPAITYLRGRGTESSPWAASSDHIQLESDFAIVQVISVAISNLWAVARRRYLAVPGCIHLLLRDHVDVAFLAATVLAGHQATGLTVPLHTKINPSARWGEGFGETRLHLDAVRISDALARRVREAAAHPQPIQSVNLPVLQIDRSPFTGSARYLLPFSPEWSSSI